MEDEQILLEDCPTEEQDKFDKRTPLIFAWGKNDDGQLGVPSTKTAAYPSASKGFKGYARQIATARSHTVMLNEQGQIYLAGSLLFGKIGITSQINNFRQFKLHQQMSQYVVKKVACGDYHTLALVDDGTVFSWGGTLWDKTGHKGGGISRMQKLVGQLVVDIACGDCHSMSLNSVGQVYSWGGGGQNKNKGQLGHSNKKDLPHPQEIKFFKDKKVAKIYCGDYHSMIITQSGDLYSFGQGSMGQLGNGAKQDISTPKKVKINFQLALQEYFRADLNQETKIEQIALGGHHSLLLTNKGHVYVCGYGSQGQLGLGHGHTDNKYEPTLVKSLLGKQIIMISAGATHSLALSSKHDVYSCGYNAKGQLGLGEQKTATMWTHITTLSGKNVSKIYAGGDHSWAVIDQFAPIIKNYEPPSPIKVVFDEATMIKHNESSRPEKSAISNNSMDQILVSLTPHRKLELILTQTQKVHRFIHVVFKQNFSLLRKKVDSYLNFVQQNQRAPLILHKVDQDTELVNDKSNQIIPKNPRGATIMMVSQLSADATQHLDLKSKTSLEVGDLYMVEPSMLKIENRIPNHNLWFFKFNEMFDDVIEKIRIIQLRPKSF